MLSISLLKKSIRPFYRYIKMFIIRKKYNIKYVSDTLYISGKIIVSKDLIAGDYVFDGRNF